MSATRDINRLQALEEELRITKAQLAAFINNAAVAFIVHDLDGVICKVNTTFEKLFGWTEEEAVGQALPLMPAEMQAEFDEELAARQWQLRTSDTLRRRKDGTLFPASETIVPVRDGKENIGGYARIVRDITSRKQEVQRLQESEYRYRSLFENNPDAVFSLDLDGKFTALNEAVRTVTGYEKDDLLQKHFLVLIQGEEEVRLLLYLFERVKQGTTQSFELQIHRKCGEPVELNVTTIPIKIGNQVVGMHGIAKDITEQKRNVDLIHYMAYHDALTDLPNRRLFHDRVELALEEAKENGHKLAVMVLDMDRFKVINDSLGHATGDEVLKQVAGRLRSCLRYGDTVARMGGDEFTLLLPSVRDTADALLVAQRILDRFHMPIAIVGREFHLTPSIGVAMYPEDGASVATLLQNADAAMYRVKEQGKNHYQVYSANMTSEALERMSLDTELRQALDRGEFLLHYQPQVNVMDGEIIGMEALVRWQHPERGLLYPGAFIKAAEETGLIVPLGEWVLRKACEQTKAWQLAGYKPLRVGVNLSLGQFKQDNLIEMVAEILRETGLDPKYLELEITESIAMADTEQVIRRLNQLVELGVTISIDDFGTGFSSLSYLKIFPIHKLKIDRSFIIDITNRSDSSIVAAIIGLAKSLNIRVIVEGVETEVQRTYLPMLGAEEMQGYLFSTPVPPDRFETMLRERRLLP